MRQVKNGVVTGRGDGPYSVRDRKAVTFLLVDRFLSIISISNLVTLKKNSVGKVSEGKEKRDLEIPG